MKTFLIKISSFILFYTVVLLILSFAIPSNNDYLSEYNHKIELLKNTQQPRIIFVGGSSVAFGLDSKKIIDSLHTNVINFGLHAGIGIRFPLEDCLSYTYKGDIVVLPMEYAFFFEGGNGHSMTFLPFMIETNWRNYDKLNIIQWKNIILGVYDLGTERMRTLLFSPGSIESKRDDVTDFKYERKGFNQYGDHVSHWGKSVRLPKIVKKKNTESVDSNFARWFTNIINEFEKKGVTIIMIPPVCIESLFYGAYNENISSFLNKIHHPYIVEPSSMVLDDSCAFDTGYHMNYEGVIQNTDHIINVLKKCINNPNNP